ncbi:MAG: type II toxin-antitoxin system RelE/ParE family toxin [Solirubrobacterales bacterium]|nr:type II toxin-antitoxin system RelE/ParE family toxin [Solirubrobacterales bacterium]
MVVTKEFERWSDSLSPELRSELAGALDRIADVGPTLGRPVVDRVHGSRLHKLKEARIDRSTRVLFAFDSNRRAVMLVGGDKTGEWNGWYPRNIERAERLYLEHERDIGKEPRCLSQREAGRTSSQRSR